MPHLVVDCVILDVAIHAKDVVDAPDVLTNVLRDANQLVLTVVLALAPESVTIAVLALVP